MAKNRKSIQIVIIFLLFIAYFFFAARPIPRETVLTPVWISSLEAEAPVVLRQTGRTNHLTPFNLGSRFGYVDSTGQFVLNKIKSDNVYLSENMWTEYPDEPSQIEVKNITGETIVTIEKTRGYPVLLDNRIFILGSEMNSLSEIDTSGNVLWTYEYGAILTTIDAAAGLVLTGSIDGVIEILNSEGRRIFHFRPGGSRYEVILGCAISRNGSHFGVISGIDQQRFLLFERHGNIGGEYKVVYHEFLETGFRREVRVLFIDDDRRIVYECENGLGVYNIKARRGTIIPLDGEIAAIDASGDQGFFFLITSRPSQRKELIGIKFSQDGLFRRSSRNTIFMRALFRSDDVFLGRTGSTLIIGGGKTLISFDLEAK